MMKFIGGALVVAVVVGLIGWGIFTMKRSWNYSWGYQDKVEETVCDMVKPEYLVDPSKC